MPPTTMARQLSAAGLGLPGVAIVRDRFTSMGNDGEGYSRRQIVVIPFLCCFIFLFLTLGFANTFFAVQALVVGADTYNDGPQCQRDLAIWLIVFGSLALGGEVLRCFKTTSEETNSHGEIEKVKHHTSLSQIGVLVGFVSTGWLLYGVHLVYNSPELACNPSQYHVFYILVLVLFYMSISMIGCICLFLPIMTCAAAGLAGGNGGSNTRHYVPERATGVPIAIVNNNISNDVETGIHKTGGNLSGMTSNATTSIVLVSRRSNNASSPPLDTTGTSRSPINDRLAAELNLIGKTAFLISTVTTIAIILAICDAATDGTPLIPFDDIFTAVFWIFADIDVLLIATYVMIHAKGLMSRFQSSSAVGNVVDDDGIYNKSQNDGGGGNSAAVVAPAIIADPDNKSANVASSAWSQ